MEIFVDQRHKRLVINGVAFALVSFICISISMYAWLPSDDSLLVQYEAEVSPIAYLMPALAFGTALLLNTLTLAVERSSVKMQMTLIVCYINLVAGLTDCLGYLGMTPVLKDPWGQGVVVTRLVMWLWTTPAMVYLLGLISDMSQKEVLLVVGADIVMMAATLFGCVQGNPTIGAMSILFAMCMYVYTMRGVWRMFQAPINSAGRGTSAMSLEVVRIFTVVMWTGFVVIFMISRARLVSIGTEEWLWGVFDFLGKVMFSSSLLQSNFITMEERRLHAMKVVEEGRRDQVIKELTSLVQQKEQFMNSMGNELRTPLNGIIGLSDALLIGCCGEMTEVSHKTIEIIKNSGLRLLSLINDILDAATMQQGKLIIRQERVRLDRVIDDVMDLLKPLARKNVRLVNDVPASIPAILGDNGRLLQVFHNLVGNACKFTHMGSIVVTAMLKMDEVEVAVADSGTGISRDRLDSMFKPFSDDDPQSVPQYRGTGLGLTLVKQLVEAHDGAISVKSKFGVGTTFYLSFKVWDPAVHSEDVNKVMTPNDIEATKQRVSRMMSILNMRGGPARAPAGQPSAVTHKNPEKSEAILHSYSTGLALTTKRPGQDAALDPFNLPITPQKSDSLSKQATPPAGQSGTPVLARKGESTSSNGSRSTPKPAAQAADANAAYAKSGPLARIPSDDGDGAEKAVGADESGEKDEETRLRNGPVKQRSVVWAAGTNEGVDAPVPLRGGGRSMTGRQFHVLSVDDDDINQMVVENWLIPEGFLVTKAMDGQEALELLKDMETLPDVILLDVMMPGMDGYEVCRLLRELYPNSCVPVIMVSAKGKEDDVVQGLAVGANDYIVKPYGQKEILARIQAHLRYRKQVMKVASDLGTESDKKSRLSDNLVELLCAESKAFSLPASIKSKVENSTGVSAPLQVFDDLTMIVIGINNLDVLTAGRGTSMPELLGALASLFIYLEELLPQYSAYIVDCMEDKLVIVTGLSGDRLTEQTCNAVDLCTEVQKLAATLMPGGGTSRLLLSAGIHCCTATAAIVGVQHPVLQVTGALAEKATQLQATCPPGCIHVSKRVYELCARPKDFAPAVRLQLQTTGFDATFMHRSGPWAVHLAGMQLRFDRYMSSHPFGPINSTALRWRPVQRAMLCLIQADVGWLVELLSNSSGGSYGGRYTQASTQYGSPAMRVVQEGLLDNAQSQSLLDARDSVSSAVEGAEGAAKAPEALLEGLKLVTKLQLDKEELQRQLEHKTTDTDRLQVMVDNLQLDLYGLEALQAQLMACHDDGHKLREQVAMLQRQLLAAHSGSGPQEGSQAAPGTALEAWSAPGPRAGGTSGPGTTVVTTQVPVTSQDGSQLDDPTEDLGSMFLCQHTAGEADYMPSITQFLTGLGMPHLAPVFVLEEITPDMLPYIHDATLLQLGVTSVGDLVRIRRAAQAL